MDPGATAPHLQELLAHAAFVRRVAQALMRDDASAEDLVQDTWCAALEHPPRRAGPLAPWLGTLTRNLARRRWRAERRRVARELDAARLERVPSVASTLEREEALRAVVDAVLGLPEPYRTTVLERYYDGLPPRTIAARHTVPVETVRTRLRRGLVLLRQGLGAERGPGHVPAVLAALGDSHPVHLLQGAATAATTLMKTKVTLAAALLLTLSLAWFGQRTWSGSRSDATPAPSASSIAHANAGSEPMTAAEGESRRPAPSVPAAAAVAGHVTDASGTPVADAVVFVGAARDPFHDDHPAPRAAVDQWTGRTFTTDADGRWQTTLAAPARVLVAVLDQPHYDVAPAASSRWVEAPAAEVEFVVRRVPTAELEVRALSGASGRPLDRFRASLNGPRGVGFQQVTARDGLLRCRLPVADAGGVDVQVVLSDPKFERPVQQAVRLLPDGTHRVTLVLPDHGSVSGVVVDESGYAVADALVFFGDETVGRGNEPFSPFQESRVLGGVRTRADGWFRLEGQGALVTAWHDSWSPATVARGDAARIVLGPRGEISGRLVDERGQPLTGTELRLDHREKGRRTTTCADGRFTFGAVEAGVRALWLGPRLLVALRVAAGESVPCELRVGDPVPFTIVLRDPRPAAKRVRGVLVGEGKRFHVFQVDGDGRTLRSADTVPPGRYLLLTDDGVVASIVAEGNAASLELDAGAIEVHAAPATRLAVVPASADEFVRRLALRLPMRTGADGTLRFLTGAGRFAVLDREGKVLREVDVAGSCVSVRL